MSEGMPIVKIIISVACIVLAISVFYSLKITPVTYKEKSWPKQRRIAIMMFLFLGLYGIFYHLGWLNDSPNLRIVFLMASSFMISLELTQIKYFICPHCLKNIKAERSWKCPFCNETNKATSVFYQCNHCKERLDHYNCPECKNDIDFNIPYSEKELRKKRNV